MKVKLQNCLFAFLTAVLLLIGCVGVYAEDGDEIPTVDLRNNKLLWKVGSDLQYVEYVGDYDEVYDLDGGKLYVLKHVIMFVDNDVENLVIPEGVIGSYYDITNKNQNIKSIKFPSSYRYDIKITDSNGTSIVDVTRSMRNMHESLETIEVAGDNPYLCAENNILYNKDKTSIIFFAATKPDTSFTMPSNVVHIDDNAFSYCKNLKDINISEGVSEIGDDVFANCTSLTDIKIPNGVTVIGGGAFANCTSLTDIKIPDSVCTIGNSAFANCTSLTEIDLPSTLGRREYSVCQTVDSSTFRGCTNLTSINVAEFTGEDTTYYYFSRDGVLYYKNREWSELIAYPPNKAGSIFTLHGDTEKLTVKSCAFEKCRNLETINIIGNVGLEPDVFAYASLLKNINVSGGSENYISIDGVLYGDKGKTLMCYPAGKTDAEFKIPDGVDYIEYAAFCGCADLKSLIMSDTVEEIGNYRGEDPFENCVNLENVVISNKMTEIHDCFSYGCDNLLSVTIPPSVIEISSSFDCDAEKVVFYVEKDSYAEQWAIKEGYNTFVDGELHINRVYRVDGSEVRAVNGTITQADKEIKEFDIPEEITAIASSAFSGCADLSKVVVPDTVTQIANNAFEGCDKEKLVFYVNNGSYAETWAIEHNFKTNYIAAVVEKVFAFGDADADDVITASDAAAVMQKALVSNFELPIEKKSDNWLKYVDVDADTYITASDAAFILQKTLVNTFELPAEKIKA